MLLLLLFVILYFWISIAFWTATFGFVSSLTRRQNRLAHGDGRAQSDASTPLPPTAIVMPIHNEDSRRVFANLRAIRESLRSAGHAAAFDVFVLSDTRDPDIWAEEEFAWAQMRARRGSPDPAESMTEGLPQAWRPSVEPGRGQETRAQRATGGQGGLFYRRRTENTDRKSGNIQDFCQRWG